MKHPLARGRTIRCAPSASGGAHPRKSPLPSPLEALAREAPGASLGCMHGFDGSSTVSNRSYPALAAERLIVAVGLILGGLAACGSAEGTGGVAGEGGTTAAPSEPAAPIVALARNHYCIVANDQVWCAGGLSTNGPLYNATPEQIAVVGARISAIAVSIQHGCSLHVDGAVSCWGANGARETGTDSAPPGTCAVFVTDGGSGEAACQPNPTRVTGLENVTALQLGDARSCALTTEGAVQCWGLPFRGPEWLAQQSGVASIAIGNQAACALFGEGRWGCSDAQFATLRDWTDVTAVAMSQDTELSCVLRGGGRVDCWGPNAAGQRGIGNTDPMIPLPDDPPALAANATQLAIGEGHACALMMDGSVQCWGRNGYGELGAPVGDSARCPGGPCQTTAQLVAGLPAAAGIAAGGNTTCAVTSAGDIYCWGELVQSPQPTLLRGPWSN
jgi:hypothetical protein